MEIESNVGRRKWMSIKNVIMRWMMISEFLRRFWLIAWWLNEIGILLYWWEKINKKAEISMAFENLNNVSCRAPCRYLIIANSCQCCSLSSRSIWDLLHFPIWFLLQLWCVSLLWYLFLTILGVNPDKSEYEPDMLNSSWISLSRSKQRSLQHPSHWDKVYSNGGLIPRLTNEISSAYTKIVNW